MEIRMRSAVSRTAKGYSIETTLDMGSDETPVLQEYKGQYEEEVVAEMSAFQIRKLQEHMKALGEAFPREDV